jgi:hypothetical protein
VAHQQLAAIFSMKGNIELHSFHLVWPPCIYCLWLDPTYGAMRAMTCISAMGWWFPLEVSAFTDGYTECSSLPQGEAEAVFLQCMGPTHSYTPCTGYLFCVHLCSMDAKTLFLSLCPSPSLEILSSFYHSEDDPNRFARFGLQTWRSQEHQLRYYNKSQLEEAWRWAIYHKKGA